MLKKLCREFVLSEVPSGSADGMKREHESWVLILQPHWRRLPEITWADRVRKFFYRVYTV